MNITCQLAFGFAWLGRPARRAGAAGSARVRKWRPNTIAREPPTPTTTSCLGSLERTRRSLVERAGRLAWGQRGSVGLLGAKTNSQRPSERPGGRNETKRNGTSGLRRKINKRTHELAIKQCPRIRAGPNKWRQFGRLAGLLWPRSAGRPASFDRCRRLERAVAAPALARWPWRASCPLEYRFVFPPARLAVGRLQHGGRLATRGDFM